MKRPSLAVRRYRHSSTHPYYLDLRAFNQGRKFFKTKAEAEAERMRQITLRERGGREAVGLPLNELAAIIQARSALAKHGKSINDAARFYLDHLERIRRCNITVAQLAAEVLAAKQKDGFSALYLTDLRKRLNRFGRDFGTGPSQRSQSKNWTIGCATSSAPRKPAQISEQILACFSAMPSAVE